MQLLSSTPERERVPGPAQQLGLYWGTAALVLLALSPWASFIAARVPACLWKSATGIPCPACGTTRAALHLAHFEIAEAFSAYPLASLGWTLLIAGGLVAGIGALAGYGVPSLRRLLRRPGSAGTLRVAIGLALLANWAWLIVSGA